MYQRHIVADNHKGLPLHDLSFFVGAILYGCPLIPLCWTGFATPFVTLNTMLDGVCNPVRNVLDRFKSRYLTLRTGLQTPSSIESA
jgi:hypothetical protein